MMRINLWCFIKNNKRKYRKCQKGISNTVGIKLIFDWCSLNLGTKFSIKKIVRHIAKGNFSIANSSSNIVNSINGIFQ